MGANLFTVFGTNELGETVSDSAAITRLSPETFVGEVVMKAEMTPLLQAAKERGCRFQIGTDMLFEMIPAYLEFFGYGTATADELRSVAKISY